MTTSAIEPDQIARAQSLAHGAVGTALLHIERAHNGSGTWSSAHTALSLATRGDLTSGTAASLYYGAPAVAFALHAAAQGTGRYTRALNTLDVAVTALTRQRLEAAHRRIENEHRPHAAEFDIFYGLTGLGAHLLRRHGDGDVQREVLGYLVRLTHPLPGDPDRLPGWWSPAGPTHQGSTEFADGHGNFGMAHGITGPLALLSLAALSGITVAGQHEAVSRVLTWLDTWRQDGEKGPWWPQWITLAEHRTGRVRQAGPPPRPSWCYGTPGLARAQQLAARAMGDTTRQRAAERALLACLDDPAQLDRVTDGGLCHGAAGVLHTTHRVAHDALTSGFAERLPRLRARVHDQPPAREKGFLDGTTGTALALDADAAGGLPASGWDTCLLLG